MIGGATASDEFRLVCPSLFVFDKIFSPWSVTAACPPLIGPETVRLDWPSSLALRVNPYSIAVGAAVTKNKSPNTEVFIKVCDFFNYLSDSFLLVYEKKQPILYRN